MSVRARTTSGQRLIVTPGERRAPPRGHAGWPAVCLLPLLLLLYHPRAVAGQDVSLADGLVSLTDVEIVKFGDGVGSWIDAAVFPDGDLLVADMFTASLMRVSPGGESVWRVGRRGEGPGEFARLYRVGVGPRGMIAAYDMTSRHLSFFSPDGEFLKRRVLDLLFRQVDGVVLISDSLVAVSGTTPVGMPSDEYAIHVFDDEGSHIRSFGPLPRTEDREVLGYWGAGMIRPGSGGEILYTRRLPYEVYRFAPDGTQMSVTEVAVPTVGAPDDRYEITREPTYRVRHTGAVITHPIVTIDVGGGLLMTSRYEGDRRYMTLVEEEGGVAADVQLEVGQGIPVDGRNGVLWLSDSSSGLGKTLLRARMEVEDGRDENGVEGVEVREVVP